MACRDMSSKSAKNIVLYSIVVIGNAAWCSAFKDWYFGIDKVPDFRMMAVKPVATISDSVIYTCSAAVNRARLSISFLINFNDLASFCGPKPLGTTCQFRPHVVTRRNLILPPLTIYEAQLEFNSREQINGTVSCSFEDPDDPLGVLAQLYGFFDIDVRSTNMSANDFGKLCAVQQGCRHEAIHCEDYNHITCPACQEGMGFDSFYHLCYDPRQIDQSCVYKHQCQRADPRSLCKQRRCQCRPRHSDMGDGCKAIIELGYLCGGGTQCRDEMALCVEHACKCQAGFQPSNGRCVPMTSIDVKDVLVMATSTMIVFTALTSMLCVLLREHRPDDEEGNRSRYSLTSIR
ncbi:uncharacterized protein ISCGN_028540 [Ixodes scapularis]